jgi:release factor glutamine methyltransferase
VIGKYLASVSEILNPFSDTPFLDASVLLANMLGKSRAWILAHPEAPIPLDQRQLVDNAILRLEAGEPLPYVIGHWEFYGLDFQLNAATLIPRPETELLVEKALEWLKEHPGPCMAADVGTGSGCIAVALAHHMTDLKVIATDISAFALRAAKANAIRHNVASRVAFVQGNLMESIEESFDIIGANLPYIPTRTLHMLDVYKSEPELALDGGADGLNLIRSLLAQAPERLSRNGRLLVEIEMNQPAAATSIAKAVFPHSEVHVFPDLAGKDRLLVVDNIQPEIERLKLS